jgi:hypothetical protein
LSPGSFDVALHAAALGCLAAIAGIALERHEGRAVFVLWLIMPCLLILGAIFRGFGAMR